MTVLLRRAQSDEGNPSDPRAPPSGSPTPPSGSPTPPSGSPPLPPVAHPLPRSSNTTRQITKHKNKNKNNNYNDNKTNIYNYTVPEMDTHSGPLSARTVVCVGRDSAVGTTVRGGHPYHDNKNWRVVTVSTSGGLGGTSGSTVTLIGTSLKA